MKNEFLIDTDVMLEHLFVENVNVISVLEKLAVRGMLFTSAINASELIFEYGDGENRKNIIQLLNSMKVLGIHSRYSLSVSEFIDSVKTYRDSLFCVVAKINKLTIVTMSPEKYSKTGLNIINGFEVIQ